jgi:hypothetical protein
MKFTIIDYSNEGILFVGDSQAVVNQLKAGLVDTEMRMFYPRHPSYDKINRQEILFGDKHVFVKRDNSVVELPATALNPAYLERRRLVKLRAPLMEMLIRFTYTSTQICRPTAWDGIENNLQFALRDCDPDAGVWSDAIQEYAQINSVEPQHAYREIKLQMDNIHSIKMRVYGFLKLFSDKINQVADMDQARNIMQEMENKFFKDTWI